MRKMREFYQRLVREQEQWIEQHGENLSGYVANYGSASQPDHYGDGGEAIYRADMNALNEYRRSLAQQSA